MVRNGREEGVLGWRAPTKEGVEAWGSERGPEQSPREEPVSGPGQIPWAVDGGEWGQREGREDSNNGSWSQHFPRVSFNPHDPHTSSAWSGGQEWQEPGCSGVHRLPCPPPAELIISSASLSSTPIQKIGESTTCLVGSW